MKRQNHRMTVNTRDQWPIEELREKTNILHQSTDHREMRNLIPSVARGKVGFASDDYQRAVAELAYEIWEKGGRSQDSANTDWFKAEETLKPAWVADLSFASGELASNNPGKL